MYGTNYLFTIFLTCKTILSMSPFSYTRIKAQFINEHVYKFVISNTRFISIIPYIFVELYVFTFHKSNKKGQSVHISLKTYKRSLFWVLEFGGLLKNFRFIFRSKPLLTLTVSDEAINCIQVDSTKIVCGLQDTSVKIINFS